MNDEKTGADTKAYIFWVKKDKEIAELKNKLATFDKDKELEINKLIAKLNTELSEKDSHIATLKGEKALTEKECQLKEQSLKETKLFTSIYKENLEEKGEKV